MMSKGLELLGLGLIGGTIVSFVGMGDSELRWPDFLGMCNRNTCNHNLSKTTKKKTRSKFIKIDQ